MRLGRRISDLFSMDLIIFNFFHNLAGQSNVFDLLIIFLARYLPYFAILIFVVKMLSETDRRERMRAILFSLLSITVSYGLIRTALNFFVFRVRPFAAMQFKPLVEHAASAAFPSGHAVFYFTLAALAFIFFGKRWGMWFTIGAVFIGLARIVAGLHWPTDIAAGALIGFFSPFLLQFLLPQKKTVAPSV